MKSTVSALSVLFMRSRRRRVGLTTILIMFGALWNKNCPRTVDGLALTFAASHCSCVGFCVDKFVLFTILLGAGDFVKSLAGLLRVGSRKVF